MSRMMQKMNNREFDENRIVEISENSVQGNIVFEVVSDGNEEEVISIVIGIDNGKVDDHIKSSYHEMLKDRMEQYIKDNSKPTDDPPVIESEKRYFCVPLEDTKLVNFSGYARKEKN